ncbi:unnamed protein product, partial [Meganyctiphanes norvegica]
MDEDMEGKVKNEFEIYEEPFHTHDINKIIKDEIDKNEEPVQIKDVDIKVGEERVKYEKPVAEITEFYPVKHQIIHVDYKLHQCSHSENSYLTSHLRTQPGEKLYQCSQCENKMSHNNYRKIHMR